MKRLADISQKYNEAAVDNRVLKADVETLRAKVGDSLIYLVLKLSVLVDGNFSETTDACLDLARLTPSQNFGLKAESYHRLIQ